MTMGSYLSIITLNVNRLNTPTKRQRLVEWIKKTKALIYVVYKRPTSKQGTRTDWKWRAGKNISCKKKARVAILRLDKIDFEIKAVKIVEEGHYIMIKGSIQKEI